MKSVRGAVLNVFAAVAVALSGLLGTFVSAAPPTELFFSEYIEGSGNNKALEIYNGTAVPVALTGYSVQTFFNGSATPGLTIPLTGSIAAGDVFVLAHASASPAILAQADLTSGGAWFNGDDAVTLRHGGTVVDAIGQAGVDPGAEWGTGLVSTADNTLRRGAAICGGDADPTDVFDPAGQWLGAAIDSMGDLGVHASTCGGLPPVDVSAPAVSSSSPAPGGLHLNTASLTVSFSEPVVAPSTAFAISCDAAPVAFALTGGPATFTLDPAVDLPANGNCVLTVSAAAVSDVDLLDPPDAMAADYSAAFVAANGCGFGFTPIAAIQGAGAVTPMANAIVTTQGVVVGDYELTSAGGPGDGIRGFYLQDPAGDGNPATSDGLFVFNGNNNDVSLGDIVRVTGSVGEFFEQTQIAQVQSLVRCGTGTVAPVNVLLPVPAAPPGAPAFLERFEGMLVRLPQTLSVTEHFQLGRFGQVVVSSGGRLAQPTDVAAPGPAADAVHAANALNRITIDDDRNSQNPDPIAFGRGGAPLSAANTLRGGDTLTATVGVMGYTFGGNGLSANAYRVRPLGALQGHLQVAAANPRPVAAPERGGSLRVAGMNLLNYFNSFGNACTAGVGGAAVECRGADDAGEFARQWPKTVAAIAGTQADVIGVIEVENDGYGSDSALQHLVDQLNAAAGAGTYALIDADAGTGQVNALGRDAIKVGLVYKPARVIPVGQTAALNTVSFETGGDSGPRNRPALVQAFEEFGTGARFIVAVNHLKSKGSGCDADLVAANPPAAGLQGNCNQVRRQAASELAAWLASQPTGVADPDVLLLGDFNAYSREEPMTVLANAGYADLASLFHGANTYSYVFDGQWGSLDHALASASLLTQVKDAADWFINADEPSVLDYNDDFKSAGQLVSLYAANAYRMADHDPVIVDLDLTVETDDGR